MKKITIEIHKIQKCELNFENLDETLLQIDQFKNHKGKWENTCRDSSWTVALQAHEQRVAEFQKREKERLENEDYIYILNQIPSDNPILTQRRIETLKYFLKDSCLNNGEKYYLGVNTKLKEELNYINNEELSSDLYFLSFLGIVSWSYSWEKGRLLKYFSLNQERIKAWKSEKRPIRNSQRRFVNKMEAFKYALQKKRAKEDKYWV